MAVVILDHSGVGVSQLRCDHRERHAAHGKPAGVGIAQPVKIDGRINSGRRPSCAERPLLFWFAPWLATSAEKQTRAAGLSRDTLSD